MPAPTHKWRQGDAITAKRLEEMARRFIEDIIGGPGVHVSRNGQKVIISFDAGRSVGSSTLIVNIGGWSFCTAYNKASLPVITGPGMGYTTSDKHVWVHGADRTGTGEAWIGITRLYTGTE